MGDEQPDILRVFVVSDGTGDTGNHAVRAAMAQFPKPWRLRTIGEVRGASEAKRVVAMAAESQAFVVYSLVDGAVIEVLNNEAQRLGVVAVDLLGPLLEKLAKRLHIEPAHKPGLLHGFSDDYLKRVDAVEYAVRHDDGGNLATLWEADIVLTGVSRTSKTPLSMYLAQRGYKTGNVPLVPGLDPPRELLELDRRKVFGLIIDPTTLLSVRQARLRALRISSSSSYTDSESVVSEVTRARRLFRRRGWRTIDVSGRAVEENASRIIEYVEHMLEPHGGRR
jgi:regulator of PEP synthase PpsR (kinase-PPPase family)